MTIEHDRTTTRNILVLSTEELMDYDKLTEAGLEPKIANNISEAMSAVHALRDVLTKAPCIYDAWDECMTDNAYRVFMTPASQTYVQQQLENCCYTLYNELHLDPIQSVEMIVTYALMPNLMAYGPVAILGLATQVQQIITGHSNRLHGHWFQQTRLEQLVEMMQTGEDGKEQDLSAYTHGRFNAWQRAIHTSTVDAAIVAMVERRCSEAKEMFQDGWFICEVIKDMKQRFAANVFERPDYDFGNINDDDNHSSPGSYEYRSYKQVPKYYTLTLTQDQIRGIQKALAKYIDTPRVLYTDATENNLHVLDEYLYCMLYGTFQRSLFVSHYVTTRRYGGPEEGDWYYDHVELVDYRVVPCWYAVREYALDVCDARVNNQPVPEMTEQAKQNWEDILDTFKAVLQDAFVNEALYELDDLKTNKLEAMCRLVDIYGDYEIEAHNNDALEKHSFVLESRLGSYIAVRKPRYS